MKITPEVAERIYLAESPKAENAGQKALIFYVKDVLNHRLNLLKTNFPEGTLHAVAIKTCDHPAVLEHIVSQGCGLEAASLEEVLLAKKAGAQNELIVFDSPVKTREEISHCHHHLPGLLVNANSLEELERYPEDFSGRLGLRINPLVKNEAQDLFNVSTATSKFGVPISERAAIVEACLRHTQITCLHLHIGSRISDFSANLQAVAKVVALANEINKRRAQSGISPRIDVLDIGGGIDFDIENGPNTVEKFVYGLMQIDGIDTYRLITEFGTFVHRDNSFVVSDIEYVIDKGQEVPATVFLHVGADLFVRKVYSSANLHYRYSIIRLNQRPLRESRTYSIVGPLCFAGDVLFEAISVLELQEGDKFVIHDIGANTLSMWSKHCNRQIPKMILV